MFRTHIYDLIAKLGILFISIPVLINLPYIDHPAFLFIMIALISVVFYIFFLRTLGSYLYCRLTLKMNIRFNEAKALNEALSPNPFRYFDMKWLPLKEVKALEESKKYPAALELLAVWTEERKQRRQAQKDTFNNNPAFIKVLDVLTVLVCLGFLATSILDLPPASYVIRLYCHVFDTTHYSPMLIGMLMTLVVVLPIFFYKKSKGIIK